MRYQVFAIIPRTGHRLLVGNFGDFDAAKDSIRRNEIEDEEQSTLETEYEIVEVE